ncbi:MAG: DUF3108 domain-containing protein [bacterium]|nr:DUF3108 domain-containing protein [bacterium]
MKKISSVLLILIVFLSISVTADYSSGLRLLKEKKYTEAETEFKSLMDSDPDNFDYAYHYALSLLNQEQEKQFKKGIYNILKIWEKKEIGFWDQEYDKTLRDPFGKTLSRSGIVFCEALKANNPHLLRYSIEFQTYFKDVLYDGHWGQWRDRVTSLKEYLERIKGIDLNTYNVSEDKKGETFITANIKFDNFVISIRSESFEYPLRIAGLTFNNKDLFYLSERSFGPVVGKLFLKNDEIKLKKVQNSAFKEGEYIIYEIKYGPIKAGYSTMTIPEVMDLRGYKVYHCVSEARTSKFFDFTYKVRNKYESFFEVNSFASLKYIENSKEGDREKYRETYYNIDTLTGKYEDTEFGIAPNAADVVAALYYVRTQNLQPGKVIEIDTTAGTKNYKLEVEVQEGGSINSEIGKFDTYLVTPKLKYESGIFRAQGELKIWMTKDQRHIPLKLNSKVIVGSFEAEIIDYSLNGAPKSYDKLFK